MRHLLTPVLASVPVLVLAGSAAAQLDAVLEWAFDTDEIISMPAVADVDDDGLPEVVVNLTQMDGGSWESGSVVILDGDTGLESLRVPHDPPNDQYGSHGRSTLAVGDVSGDGIADIVYATRPLSGVQSLIVAIDSSGSLLWRSHAPGGADYLFTVTNAAITLANFDADAAAEVVVGASLLDNDGMVVWDQDGGGNGSTYGSNSAYIGGISVVADLDGNGIPEIVSGRDAWEVDWQPGPAVTVFSYWSQIGLGDGYPAIADFDANGTPEVVLVGSSQVSVLDATSGSVLAGPAALPGGGRGGPPVVADLDGDGEPEIGVAGGSAYTVFDVDLGGAAVSAVDASARSLGSSLQVKWSQPVQDLSSNATGSSAFDFDGDGAAEVLFADQCFLHVYSGVDGSLDLLQPNSSATIHEFPVVVDVDGDGAPELLVVASSTDICSDPVRQGLYVYGSSGGQWGMSREVWTQHTYHVTNATDDGNVPLMEENSWEVEGLNAYRQSVFVSDASSVGNLPAGERPHLSGPVPNPFNPRTTIAFELARPADVSLRVYDVAGRLVRTLAERVPTASGRHEVIWDGRGRGGHPMPAGVYFYRLEVGDAGETRRMVLVR